MKKRIRFIIFKHNNYELLRYLPKKAERVTNEENFLDVEAKDGGRAQKLLLASPLAGCTL